MYLFGLKIEKEKPLGVPEEIVVKIHKVEKLTIHESNLFSKLINKISKNFGLSFICKSYRVIKFSLFIS